jgi:hypothetical protein
VTSGRCLFFYNWGMRSRNLAVVFAGLLVSCGGSGDALAPETGDLYVHQDDVGLELARAG